MDWSPQQCRALDAVGDWFRSPDQLFYLAGNAGSGKTTLARHFREAAGVNAVFAAYTGKAAYVMRQKGCSGATTIHKLIYQPSDKSKKHLLALQEIVVEIKNEIAENGETEELRRELANVQAELKAEESNLKRPIFSLNLGSQLRGMQLAIIDECSMIDQQVGEDLLSFGTKILVLGDPAQLPPVGSGGYFTKRKPDFMLTEVHRQAQDNPIIKLATAIREGRGVQYGEYGSSRVIPWAEVTRQDGLDADQILVGTNALRRGTNAKMREVLGRGSTPYPLPGDKLVCLRNDHQAGLLNGGIWSALDSECDQDDPLFVDLTLQSEDGDSVVNCLAHADIFIGKEVPWYDKKDAQEFDYGYALTVHKAQGSQWDNVLVFDQSSVFRQDARKWLYTAVTRAAERVTIVRK